MKTKTTFVACASCIFVALAMRMARSDEQQKPPGWEPYFPTRLEWLAMEMNASYRHQITSDMPYGISFTHDLNNDAIKIHVQYEATMQAVVLDGAVKSAKETLGICAKKYGWDSWLKVGDDIHPFEKKSD